MLVATLGAVISMIAPSSGLSKVAEPKAEAADRVFTGSGGKTLPPFRVARPSTLFWRGGSGGIFQLFSAGTAGGNVNSQARSGWCYLKPGRYSNTVNALGPWRILVDDGRVVPAVSLGGGKIGYRGSGGTELPPVSFRSAKTVSWTAAAGGIFQLFDDRLLGGANVNSRGRRGTTYAAAGRHRWTVNTLGAWTVGWPR
jgi:hypothetical protein